MKVAGIYPQQLVSDHKLQHAVSEPYGLSKILAIAQEEGHEIELFIPNNSFEKYINSIKQFNPEVACYSIYTCQYPLAKKIGQELKKFNSKIINIAGNRYPTYLKGDLEQPFDISVMGEGEETFYDLLNVINKGGILNQVKGIIYKNKAGVVINKPRQRIKNLDKYPNAIRFKKILSQIYRSVSIPTLSKNPHYAIMEYSRGCLGVCNFCDNANFWIKKSTKVVHRSAKKVVDEMKQIQKSCKPVIFYFMDLNFTAYPDKVWELLEEMETQGLDASWYCMSNISSAENQTSLLKAMREKGCYKIAFGVESTKDENLKKMNKSFDGEMLDVNKTKKVLRQTADLGFVNQGFYIIGFEWDSQDSILAQAKGLLDLDIHLLNIGIYTPIPLSAYYPRYKKMGIEEDLSKHDRGHLVFKHPNGLTDQSIRKLQQDIHSNYYNTPEYKAKVRKLTQIIPELRQSFEEYFQHIGEEVII